MLHFFAKLTGRLPRFLFEDSTEISFFLVAQIEANFSNGFAAVNELIFGFGKLSGFYHFRHTHVEYLLANEVEVAGRHE